MPSAGEDSELRASGGVGGSTRRLLYERLVDLHWRGEQPSHSDLSRKTGVARATIASLVDSDDALSDTPGRSGRFVGIRADSARVLGVSITHRHYFATLTDLRGDPVVAASPSPHALSPTDDALECIDKAAALVRELLNNVRRSGGWSGEPIIGVGVALPAPVGDDGWTGLQSRRPTRYTADERWKNPIDVAANFRSRVPELSEPEFPFLVTNDANAGLLAELYESRRGGDPLTDCVYLKWSTGCGGAILTRGVLYEGADGFAGELGHLVVPQFRKAQPRPEGLAIGSSDASSDAYWHVDGACERCELWGCLEQLAGGATLQRHYAARAGSRLEIEAIARRASTDDACRDLIGVGAEFIGRTLGGAVTTLNPRKVVVGGSIPREVGRDAQNIWLTPMQRAFMMSAMGHADSSVTFEAGRFERNSSVMGAVYRVLDRQLILWLSGPRTRPTPAPFLQDVG